MNKEIKHYFGDKEVQIIIGTLLRVGVVSATSIVLIGGIIFMVTHTQQKVAFETFRPEDVKFSSINGIWVGLRSFDGLAIIQFGVLLLILTPVARVVFSIFSFLIEKDYMYVCIGLIILGVILVSLYLDVAH